MQQERSAIAVLWRYLRGITAAVENVRQTPPRDLARGIVAIVGRHLTLVFSMLLAAVWWRSAPAVDGLPASTQAVYSAARTVGLISLVVLMLWDGVEVMNGTDVGAEVAKLLVRLALLAVGLVAIRACGAQIADMLAWAKDNPDAALAGVTGIAVVRVVFEASWPLPALVDRAKALGVSLVQQ